MALTSDEVNLLVYRYLQESGFVHAAFTFAHESLVAKSSVAQARVPPGALISFLQKGLQYVEIEQHLHESGKVIECDQPFSLVAPHICKAAQAPEDEDADMKPVSGAGAADGAGAGPDDAGAGAGARNGSAAGGAAGAGAGAGPKEAVVVDGRNVQVLAGHTSEVFICAWSPTEDKLASGSGDSTARIWDLSAGNSRNDPLVLKHLKHEGEKSKDVTTLDWKSDGSQLATGSYDGQARIWNRDGSLRATLAEHKGPIFSLKWNKSGTYLLSGSVDTTAVVWDAATGSVKQTFKFHSAPTLDVDWKDDWTFASCSTDQSIHVCTIGDTSPNKTFTGHEDEVNAITWDPSGSLLASCSDDCSTKLWSTRHGLVYDLREHKKEIYTIKWSPAGTGTVNAADSSSLASASFDSTIKIWDPEQGKCMHTLTKHTAMVYSVAFSPDGKYLASGSFDRCLHVWTTKDGQLVKTYKGGGGIFEVCWNSRGDKVAACFSNNTLAVMDFRM